MITVYQIQITNRQIDQVNGGETVDAFEAKNRLMISGSRRFTPDMMQYFTAVYQVETDDLEHAFELTNLWNNGHLVRAIAGTRGSSTSVGDIFERNGRLYMVDSFGFKELKTSVDSLFDSLSS